MAAPRGPYAKTPEVRARIIEAASGIFASAGYRGTTMKEVAAACDMTAKGVSHHFSSKDELLMAVLSDRDIQAGRVADHSPEALLDALTDARREPRLVELYAVLSAEAIASDHPAHAFYEQRYERIRAELSIYLETLATEPAEHVDLTATDLSTLLVAAIDGLQIQWLYDQKAIDVEKLTRAFVQLIIASKVSASTNS